MRQDNDPRPDSALTTPPRCAALGHDASAARAIALIRGASRREEIRGHTVRFTPDMLAGQYAHDAVQARKGYASCDVASLRNALDDLWRARFAFDLDAATGYALGLAGSSQRVEPTPE